MASPAMKDGHLVGALELNLSTPACRLGAEEEGALRPTLLGLGTDKGARLTSEGSPPL